MSAEPHVHQWLPNKILHREYACGLCGEVMTGDYANALEQRVVALEQERDTAVAALGSYAWHLSADSVNKFTDQLKEQTRELRQERDALQAQLAEQTATTTLLVDRLSRVGRYFLNAHGVETCAACRETDCVQATVSTCEGWLARYTIDHLPASVQSKAQRLTLTEAFVLAEERWVEAKEARRDGRSYWEKESQTKRERDVAWAALTEARRAEGSGG